MEVSQILLGILGRALFCAEFSFDAQNVDWKALYQESEVQTVSLLVFDALTEQERVLIPGEIAAQWQTAAFRSLQFNEQLRYEQTRILELLKQAEIPCVVLKGFSCAANYPNPALRCAGDIDLLVGLDGLKAAKELLEADGYLPPEGSHPFHLSMKKDWRIVELHHEPAGIPQGEMGAEIRSFFQGGEKRAVWRNGIPVFPLKEQVLTLVLHKLEHIVASGLGLRQMYDWALFVRYELTGEDWLAVKPVLKRFGLLRFTELVTRICVDWLYLPVESAPWCMVADKQIVDELFGDILRTGNFGRKENRYGQNFFTDAESASRLASFARVTIRVCRNHWPICKKYPILLPVAPLVMLCRYLKHRKEGKRPAFKPYRIYKASKGRQALYASLKPFAEE